MKVKKLWISLLKNKRDFFLLIIFIITTLFFIYNYLTTYSWDLSVYFLNGLYFFHRGHYFEVLRPPLVSLIIGLFAIIQKDFAIIFFIIFTSYLYYLSIKKISISLGFDPLALYILSINPFVLLLGLFCGTELLSLSLLIFFLNYLVKNDYKSGFFLGLAFLTRYNNFIYIPLLFFHKKIKDILKSFIAFFVVILPWFIFNYVKFGNFFYSIADQYYHAVVLLKYFTQPISFVQFFEVINIHIIFLLPGLIYLIYLLIKRYKIICQKRIIFIIISFTLLTIIFFSVSPRRYTRYLFNIIFPSLYFTYVSLTNLMKYKYKKNKNMRFKENKFFWFILILYLLISFCLALHIKIKSESYETYKAPVKDAISYLEKNNLSNCKISSNGWVALNYYGYKKGILSGPLIYDYNDSLIIMFDIYDGVGDNFEDKINNNSILYMNKKYKYVIYNNSCRHKDNIFIYNFIERTDKKIFTKYKYHINKEPCYILFYNYAIIEKICNFINFKGFKKIGPRIIE